MMKNHLYLQLTHHTCTTSNEKRCLLRKLDISIQIQPGFQLTDNIMQNTIDNAQIPFKQHSTLSVIPSTDFMS